jgi:hypothetical protein
MASKKEKELEEKVDSTSQTPTETPMPEQTQTATATPKPQQTQTPVPAPVAPPLLLQPEDMINQLDLIETEEELQNWRNKLLGTNFSEKDLLRMQVMAWMKEKDLGLREETDQAKNPFGDTVITLSGFEDVILSSFQSQKDGTATTRNDCTEAAMAMLITMLMTRADPSSSGIRYADLARYMDDITHATEKFYRFTADSRLPGVTPPFGARNLLNDYGESHEPGWTVELSAYNTKSALLQNLLDGNPTMIYGVNTGNKLPHAVVPVGYDWVEEKWIVLNPGANPKKNEKIYQVWSDQDLYKFWSGHLMSGWIWVYRSRTMVTLYPNP